jgi:hypothetical protein
VTSAIGDGDGIDQACGSDSSGLAAESWNSTRARGWLFRRLRAVHRPDRPLGLDRLLLSSRDPAVVRCGYCRGIRLRKTPAMRLAIMSFSVVLACGLNSRISRRAVSACLADSASPSDNGSRRQATPATPANRTCTFTRSAMVGSRGRRRGHRIRRCLSGPQYEASGG